MDFPSDTILYVVIDTDKGLLLASSEERGHISNQKPQENKKNN